MSEPMTPERARAISDSVLEQLRIPIGEALELPAALGWPMWETAEAEQHNAKAERPETAEPLK